MPACVHLHYCPARQRWPHDFAFDSRKMVRFSARLLGNKQPCLVPVLHVSRVLANLQLRGVQRAVEYRIHFAS